MGIKWDELCRRASAATLFAANQVEKVFEMIGDFLISGRLRDGKLLPCSSCRTRVARVLNLFPILEICYGLSR